MGLAIDTILGAAHNPSTTFTAVTLSSGDSLQVRNAAPGASIKLMDVIRSGAADGYVRVLSPLLYDNIRGITFKTQAQPTIYQIPQEIGQVLKPQDTLTVQVTGGTGEYDVAALSLYYSDLPGVSARLHSWGDVSGLIDAIRPVEVDVTNSATPGTWTDTSLTSLENLLKANTDHAVLGFVTDIHQAVVGVKGVETGNLRICGPGVTRQEDTAHYFIKKSADTGMPCIPVFNSSNAAGFFVSTGDDTASSAPVVALVLARLTQNLPN